MKILLDECIDRRLAKQLSGHEVKTVPQMGWGGVKDGELLRLAEGEFDVLVTTTIASFHPLQNSDRPSSPKRSHLTIPQR